MRPAAVTINEFTAGPNPAARSAGAVNFFRQGKAIKNAALSVYDASGNLISKIQISGEPTGTPSAKRQIGSWNFTDSKGKPVADGTYLVKGTITARDGKKEKISIILGVK